MQEKLKRIINGLRGGRFVNEASVSQGVVLPILGELGWDSSDPDIVAPEYALGGRRVDFALLDRARKPRVFVEVKRTGQADGGDVQLFEYAFHEGVQIAVLTDGQEWSIYLPAEQGSYDERRVYKLDLLERDTVESEARLRRYIERQRVISGEALGDARADCTDAAKERQLRATLPIAWGRLLTERDDILVELLADKVEDLCGYRPSLDDCAEFLTQRVGAPPRSRSSGPAPLPEPAVLRDFWFKIDGVVVPVRNGKEVLEGVLGALADREVSFLERFVARRHGRRRRYVARDRSELYPGRPDLVETHSIEIRPGWWLGTNYSRANIEKILKLACEVAGLTQNQNIEFSVG